MSLVCNQTTGLCPCLPNVIGSRCDHCQENSDDFFPFCQPCNECTEQWRSRINPLRADIEATLELIQITTATTGPDDIPILMELINLLREVRMIVDASQIDTELAGNITDLHRRLCDLTNQTQEIFARAVAVDNEISILNDNVDFYDNETSRLAILLSELQLQLEELRIEFENMTFADLDPEPYLTIALEAEERSATAGRIISQNVTELISQTEQLLTDYDTQLNESGFVTRQTENVRFLTELMQRINEYEAFLIEANSKLCGESNNDTLNVTSDGECDDVCGGVQCSTCGGNPQCTNLITMATESLNISRMAQDIVAKLRNETQERVAILQVLFENILSLRNETIGAESVAREVQLRAEELFLGITGLLDDLQRQLGSARVNPDVIEQVERETLSLKLKANQTEVI